MGVKIHVVSYIKLIKNSKKTLPTFTSASFLYMLRNINLCSNMSFHIQNFSYLS